MHPVVSIIVCSNQISGWTLAVSAISVLLRWCDVLIIAPPGTASDHERVWFRPRDPTVQFLGLRLTLGAEPIVAHVVGWSAHPASHALLERSLLAFIDSAFEH